MSSPEPPINPYQSPQAEGTPNEELRESWTSPFRQRMGLAWSWLILGANVIVFGLLLETVALTFLAPLLLGCGWLTAGCGTFVRARPWVKIGVMVNYTAIGLILCIGIALLFLPEEPAVVACLLLQVLHVIPYALNVQARRVLSNAK